MCVHIKPWDTHPNHLPTVSPVNTVRFFFVLVSTLLNFTMGAKLQHVFQRGQIIVNNLMATAREPTVQI